MQNHELEIQTSHGHTVVVDFFKPQDAPGIVALFHEVYGNAYPIKIYYDPEALIRANETGDCCSIVARTKTGQVVGVTHVFRSAPFPGIYESAAGLVCRAYRNQGIINRLEWFLFHRWTPSRPEVAGLYGESICNHIHLQKTVHELGGVDMGLEVALMPEEVYALEKSGSGRVACLFQFWSVRPGPHRVYLPSAYDDALRFLYSGLKEDRFLDHSVESLPADRNTHCQVSFFDFASVARLAIHETGTDLKERVRGIEQEVTARGAKVIQIWLKLESPWVGAAVDALKEDGYFLGGLLPRWFDQDGLLMQKLFCRPDWEKVQLYTDRAREILKMVRADCPPSLL